MIWLKIKFQYIHIREIREVHSDTLLCWRFVFCSFSFYIHFIEDDSFFHLYFSFESIFFSVHLWIFYPWIQRCTARKIVLNFVKETKIKSFNHFFHKLFVFISFYLRKPKHKFCIAFTFFFPFFLFYFHWCIHWFSSPSQLNSSIFFCVCYWYIRTSPILSS